MNKIKIQYPATNCGQVCENILRALPDWFGIESSLIQYVKDADIMPTMLAKDEEDVIGFLTIKGHTLQNLPTFIVWVYSHSIIANA